MKFSIPSAALRSSRRLAKRSNNWKVWFAWYPVRVDQETIVWLQDIARKWVGSRVHKIAGYEFTGNQRYMYGPVTHAITQPGEFMAENVAQASMPRPQFGGQSGSNGIPQSQAGGNAIQSGSGDAARQQLQNNIGVRIATLSNPPPGRYNPPPP